MATILENLGRELEQLDKEYADAFAGQSRLTRDLDLLDRMIARGKSILQRIDTVPSAARGAELTRLRDTAAQSINLYGQERAAIVRAQEVGPSFEAFSSEATSANLLFGRYGRHFAGKDRGTRDVALLGELVEELKQTDKRMGAVLEDTRNADFERDRKVVRDNLAQYGDLVSRHGGAFVGGKVIDELAFAATKPSLDRHNVMTVDNDNIRRLVLSQYSASNSDCN